MSIFHDPAIITSTAVTAVYAAAAVTVAVRATRADVRGMDLEPWTAPDPDVVTVVQLDPPPAAICAEVTR